MCPVLNVMMLATSPITWPLGKCLDFMMGEHKLQRYNNEELKYLIRLHTQKALQEIHASHLPDDVEGLDEHVTHMISGVLKIQDQGTL